MLKQFDDLMVKILLAAAAISTALGFSEMADNEGGFVFSLAPLVEPFVIMVILVINAIVGVLQESNAEEAIEKLKQMQAPPCVVVRDGAERTIDAKELVPGDVVHLRIGDAVPADCRLVNVTARSIATDQAALTGETDAVEKHTDVVSDPHVLQDKTNALFTSTLVVRGSGFAVVCTTGEATEFGKIYKSIAETEDQGELQALNADIAENSLLSIAEDSVSVPGAERRRAMLSEALAVEQETSGTNGVPPSPS